jgi:hypothetical protein
MKKILFIFLLLSVSAGSFSQQITPSPGFTQEDYLKKNLHQKTAAHFMLWGGLVASFTGLEISQNRNYNPGFWGGRNDKKYSSTGDIIAFSGLAAMVGSIPLFIVARKNKKKALGLAIKLEQAKQFTNQYFVSRSVPSLMFKINL